MAITAGTVTLTVGVVLGGITAWFGGWVDAVAGRLAEAALLMPAPLVLLLIGTRPGAGIGPVTFGALFGVIAGAGGGVIVVRAHAHGVMAAPWVEAARAAGGSDFWILRRHVMPHLYAVAGPLSATAVVGAIVVHGFASYFGQTSSQLTWGAMVYYGTTFPNPITGAPVWNAIVPPALALSLFAAGLYLMSEGLRASAASDEGGRDVNVR